MKTLNDVQLAPKRAKLLIFDLFKNTYLTKSLYICQLQNAPDYTVIVLAVPFLLKVQRYHVSSANISDSIKLIFSRKKFSQSKLVLRNGFSVFLSFSENTSQVAAIPVCYSPIVRAIGSITVCYV